MNEEKVSVYDLPENTESEIIEKIASIAWEIRSDWSDTRNECREIVRLCGKLKEFKEATR